MAPDCGVLSFDCRGHGETVTDDDYDLRLDTLRKDFVGVTRAVLKMLEEEEEEDIVKEEVEKKKKKKQDVILVGHSLGGTVVVDVAHSGDLGNTVLGYTVLDVVEGSAVDALGHMTKYLDGRPKGFKGVEEAIDWQ